MEEIKDSELTREQRLELEEQAIQALLQYGVKYSVPLKIEPKNPPKRILWWNRIFPKMAIIWRDKRIPKDWDVELRDVADLNTGETREVYMRNFHIKPLYLGTIDMIRMLSIEIEYKEDKVQEVPTQESERLMKYVPLMAKIVAVATLNCCDVADPMYKEVKPLQKFFLSHLTSARLQTLCSFSNKMSDKAGFINSIRSTLQVGTTSPKANRVE